MKKILFPGSFAPFTNGHLSLVNKALQLFDEVIIGIGQNNQKKSQFTVEKKIMLIEKVFENEPRVSVKVYDGLTVDFARKINATAILRGVRTFVDFEYERTLAEVNRKISGVETIMLFAEEQYASVNSSVVRELLSYGKDVRDFVPKEIADIL